MDALFEQHLQSKATATLLLQPSPIPHLKGSVTLEGQKIISFEEKNPHTKEVIIYKAIFAAKKEIMHAKGKSFAYHVFPKLAKELRLEGHLSSGVILHLRKAGDKKGIRQFI